LAVGFAGSILALVAAIPAQAASPPTPLHGTLGPLTADQVAALAAQANQPSIVIFKNQHSEAPATAAHIAERARALDADQSAVKSELAQLHAPRLTAFHIVNAVAATVSKAEAQRLAADPAVQAVVPDTPRRIVQPDAAGATSPGVGAATSGTAAQPICPSRPDVPLLEPEALQVMHVENQPGDRSAAAHDLASGAGVKVGIIADGLDIHDSDLTRNGQSIVFDYQDFSGYGNNAPTDGRESFLDAGSIASQGNTTYSLNAFVNPAHALPAGCNIRIKGVAPGATLAVMNVAGSAAGFFNSQIVQAIERVVVVDRVDVLNESFGGNPFPDTTNDPVALADNAAVQAGVTVVASTGDAGPTGTIGAPASDPGIIAAGGTTTLRVYRQATRYGVNVVPGGWEDNNISAVSSAGTTQFGARTVDVVAPSDRGWTLCSTDKTHYFGCADFDNGNIGQPIWAAGGTSESAPLTSGTAALVIQAYRQGHGGQSPSPALVKRIIVSTATDLGAPADHQGAGLVNTLKAVETARALSGSPERGGLLASVSSLSSTAPAGSDRTFHVTVTNTGSASRTLTPSVVRLSPVHATDDSGTVDLATTTLTFVDDRGRTVPYREHDFNVAAGADYLSGDITWDAFHKGGNVFETVFDPAGNVAEYSLLGTQPSGHGHIEVRKPAAGTWKAIIFTVGVTYAGTVGFDYFTQKFEAAGTATPTTRTLEPGQTANLTVHVDTPASAGDSAANLRLNTGSADDGSLPITLRSLVPISASGGVIQGTLTGGATFGEQHTFQFDVPVGTPSLNVAFQVPDNHLVVYGFLVDPTGEPLDVQSTLLVDFTTGALAITKTMQFFERHPAEGRWALVVWLFQGAGLDGSQFSEPFTGQISFAAPSVTATGVPNSPSTVLKRGTPTTATIDFTNTGNSTKDYFADARLTQDVSQPLLAYQSPTPLPLPLTAQPNVFVPPGSTHLTVVGQGNLPIVMDIQAAFGNPDVLGVTLPGDLSVAQARATELAPGQWFAPTEAKGPFPPTGVPSGAQAAISAVAEMDAFDAAVSADSGNAWIQAAVDNAYLYAPKTVPPGEAGSITLTITPNAPKGTVVSGYVQLETLSLTTSSGDEVVRIPYTYTVG
jgi:hypothetical protein